MSRRAVSTGSSPVGATSARGTGPRRLGVPVPVPVDSSSDGRPLRIDSDAVEAVRESWLVEDRWWTGAPLRRRYWEVVTVGGRNLIVFRDLVDGGWSCQR